MRQISLVVMVIACLGGVTTAERWTSVHSAHFVVSTDGGEKGYREPFLIPRAPPGAPSKNGKPDQRIGGVFLTGGDVNSIALDLTTESGFPVVFHKHAPFVLDSKDF